MRNLYRIIPIIFVLALSGCAEPVLKADYATERHAKSYSPKTGMSNLYLFRTSGLMGSGGAEFEIQVDDVLVGTLIDNSYIYLELSPGSHTLHSRSRRGFAHPESTLEVKLEANKNQFREMVLTGLSSTDIPQVDEVSGKNAVSKCALIPTSNWEQNQQFTEVAPAKLAKPVKVPTERLVLMPLRVPEEDKSLTGSMETALVKGLQQNYIVFSGERVAQKAHEVFMKESQNTAHKECDETKCMQNIAMAFQSELIATANVTKRDGGYFLAISIQNIFDNKVIFSNSVPCRNCDSFQVVDKLIELSSQ